MPKEVKEVVPGTPEDEDVEEVEGEKSKGKANDEKSASEAEEGGGGEEDEEEYEIAAILDAKRGYFGGVLAIPFCALDNTEISRFFRVKQKKYGYLVSWKGYSSEHNSWVNEDDAANAGELINEFWSRKRQDDKRKQTARKSEPTSSSRAPRKSVDKESSPQVESVSAKRGRGRPRKGQSEEVQSAEEEADEEEDTRAKKKKVTADGSASKAGRKSLSSLAKDTDHDGDITMLNGDEVPQQSFTNAKALKTFANLKSWEDKVETVTTVERVGDELMVYFVTTKGEHVRENSGLCAQKFPQKLIKFYESHLRWRIAGADD